MGCLLLLPWGLSILIKEWFLEPWGNGEEDLNMPLKNFIETKMDCQKRREGRMGSWLDLVWIIHGQ